MRECVRLASVVCLRGSRVVVSEVEGLSWVQYSMRSSLTPAWLIETRFMSLDVTRLHLAGLGGSL